MPSGHQASIFEAYTAHCFYGCGRVVTSMTSQDLHDLMERHYERCQRRCSRRFGLKRCYLPKRHATYHAVASDDQKGAEE